LLLIMLFLCFFLHLLLSCVLCCFQ